MASYNGVAVIRMFFHPNVSVDMAIAQTTSLVQTILRLSYRLGVRPPLWRYTPRVRRVVQALGLYRPGAAA